MALDVPADGAADGDAAQRLEGARTGGNGPHMLTHLGTSLSSLELVLNRRADAGDAGVQVSATERRLEHVEDVERGPVVVARVDVEAAREVVADGVLARAGGQRELTDAEAVRVASSAHDTPKQTVQVLYECGVENRRVENDDELFEVLAKDDARVETVSKEQAEHVVSEAE